ncbi:hypothetical protein OIV83_000295 [Microbotryomycetes sp. JL201]|nr:hypothetical protein OIV83_000295 [Microbotryomycetes sp. JL201]
MCVPFVTWVGSNVLYGFALTLHMSSSRSRQQNETIDGLRRSLKALARDHQALNPSTVAVLDHLPTDVEFAHYVHTNRPVLIKCGVQQRRWTGHDWTARREGGSSDPGGEVMWQRAIDGWTNEYLCHKLGNKRLRIAVTPDGRADSIMRSEDGSKVYFVEPATIELTMQEFLTKLDQSGDTVDPGPVYYLQSQNGNLSDEYESLRQDVGSDGPSFARRVFGSQPDVSNIWIGDDKSVTTVHKDPYENVYLVVRGSKTFRLLPPTAMAVLPELSCQPATLSYDERTEQFERIDGQGQVRWIDLDLKDKEEYQGVKVIKVTVEQGDLLYLPALWYHQVSQTVGPPPLPPSACNVDVDEYASVRTKAAAIAVNWWYDIDMSGPFWSLMDFVRRCNQLARGDFDETEFGSSDGESA